ncbi:MAG: MHYT domain-containing protein, partial [Isosphaeraceae bacterium]
MMTEELVMVGYYDYRLVALSVVISILASYAARNLSERLNAARGRAWLGWLVFGSTVDGIGTWSMHYTGMLAYHLPVPVQYDRPTVLLSLLVGILGSAAALLVVGSSKKGWTRTMKVPVSASCSSGFALMSDAGRRLPRRSSFREEHRTVQGIDQEGSVRWTCSPGCSIRPTSPGAGTAAHG